MVIGVGQEKENDVLMFNSTSGQKTLRRLCEKSSTGITVRLAVQDSFRDEFG
jgi:hypothetical protein